MQPRSRRPKQTNDVCMHVHTYITTYDTDTVSVQSSKHSLVKFVTLSVYQRQANDELAGNASFRDKNEYI